MANSSLATSNTKVRYNAEDFPRYYRQLRGLCLKSKGAWILHKLVVNPITNFERRVANLRTEVTATVPSEKGETKIDPSSPKGGAKSDSDSTPQENLKKIQEASENGELSPRKHCWP